MSGLSQPNLKPWAASIIWHMARLGGSLGLAIPQPHLIVDVAFSGVMRNVVLLYYWPAQLKESLVRGGEGDRCVTYDGDFVDRF